MWGYLRKHDLQDPKKRQFYFLDEPLKKVFGNSKRIKVCHTKQLIESYSLF
jgi:chromatin remodeling complex protein RSC6